MLRRIEIKGYKSLVDVQVDLQPLVVLFAPNGAGKSNFLDALQLLSRMAVSPTLKAAFEPPYRGKPLESFAFGDDGIPGLLKRESARFSIQADVELSPAVVRVVDQQIREMKRPAEELAGKSAASNGSSIIRETLLRYRVEVEIFPGSGVLRVADEYAAALNAKGEPTGKRRPFVERVKNRIHLRMEGQAHPSYHECFLDHTLLSRPLYPPHYPHLVALRHELESWHSFYFEPREQMRAANPAKEVRHIGLQGEELAAFLNTLRALNARQFQAVEKALHMLIPSINGIHVEVNGLGEVELRLREGNTLIPARVVSEGTLRILGLLALAGATEPPALIGLEEPENGVHPRRLQLIAELLQTRAELRETQMIVTTHSPLLVDQIPKTFLYVCRKDEAGTQIEPFEPFPLWREQEASQAIDDDGEPLSVSAQILRGDLDA
jgi:predicted ATPase